MSDKTIEVAAEVVPSHQTEQTNPPQTQALAVRQTGALQEPIPIEGVVGRVQYVRDIHRKVMVEGQDYGKIPGTGDKPSLLQPGAQKLLLAFQLREQVKKEVLREYPNWHREYEIIVTVFPAGQPPESGWDGVGTCSTLESKYRYRKAERTCPQCHKTSIIKGKEEYGGGYVCFKKKGGCGAKFTDDDQRILSQPADDVENEDPADCWNTVRKMAFKRALVAAAINATNTSDMWTQDLEDMAGNEKSRPKAPSQSSGNAPQASRPANPQSSPSRGASRQAASQPQAQPATAAAPKAATEATRTWMLGELEKFFGVDAMEQVAEYARAAGMLLPLEELQDLPLRFVPISRKQLETWQRCVSLFMDGAEAQKPFEPNPEPLPGKTTTAAAPASPPTESAPARQPENDPEWWRYIEVPIPRRGQKRAEYLQDPDTIGSLYDLRHEQTADGQDARQRLWGFVTNFEPKGWTKRDGTEMPPSEADKAFRIALDAFADWFQKQHPGEKL